MTKFDKIEILEKELESLRTPLLTEENIEDADDMYQQALEIGYYKAELREEIEYIKSMDNSTFKSKYYIDNIPC